MRLFETDLVITSFCPPIQARDLKMIAIKLFHVLIPRVWSKDSKGVEALRDCT
jgi:hypothetical protein